MDDFGVRVRAARVAAGLTQLELARAMGYSTRSTISRIESGDNQVPMDRLDALAAALRTTPAYLLGQDGAAAEPAAPQAAAQEDDPFLQEFWRCAMSLRRATATTSKWPWIPAACTSSIRKPKKPS